MSQVNITFPPRDLRLTFRDRKVGDQVTRYEDQNWVTDSGSYLVTDSGVFLMFYNTVATMPTTLTFLEKRLALTFRSDT